MAADRYLTAADLAGFGTGLDADTLTSMIGDAYALAVAAAPCLAEGLGEAQTAAVRAILRGSVLRWAAQMTRDDRQMTAGPFSIGPTPGSGGERRPLLWPSDITELQGICTGRRGRGGAFLGWLG